MTTVPTSIGAIQAPGALAADVQISLAIAFGRADEATRARMRLTALAATPTDGDISPCEPLRPADDNTRHGLTPCPIYAWCMGHESGEHVTAASLHHGEMHHAPALGLYLHRDAGVASIAANSDGGDTMLLDPDEADELAAALHLFAAAARGVAA